MKSLSSLHINAPSSINGEVMIPSFNITLRTPGIGNNGYNPTVTNPSQQAVRIFSIDSEQFVSEDMIEFGADSFADAFDTFTNQHHHCVKLSWSLNF